MAAEHTKSAAGGDGDAFRKNNNLKKNIRNKEIRQISWMSNENLEAVRILINKAVVGRPNPLVQIVMPLKQEGVPKGWTELHITIEAKQRYEVIVQGWKPVFKMDALRIIRQIHAIWQTGCLLDDAAMEVDATRPRETVLTGSRSAAIKLIRTADKRLDAICLPLINRIQDPVNWANPIPPNTCMSGICYHPIEDPVTK